MTNTFKPAFPYNRPKTSVFVKAGANPAITRDFVGTIVPEVEVTTEQAQEARGAISAHQNVIYVAHKDTLYCFAEPVFHHHVANGIIRVYG